MTHLCFIMENIVCFLFKCDTISIFTSWLLVQRQPSFDSGEDLDGSDVS